MERREGFFRLNYDDDGIAYNGQDVIGAITFDEANKNNYNRRPIIKLVEVRDGEMIVSATDIVKGLIAFGKKPETVLTDHETRNEESNGKEEG